MTADRKNHVSQIVRDAGRRLLKFIRARVPSDADAEDVLQDVWQQLLTTLDEGPVDQVGAWLYTVARHRIIDGYRRTKPTSLDALAADAAEQDDDFDLAAFFPREDATPESEHVRRVFWEQLHAALAELPQEQRQVFVWHELDALSFQDIAALTGDNVNTLLSRKRYAVLHLRRRLQGMRDEFFSQSQSSNRLSP
jgi:RNA polymerase sigma factor (sigma-70 family)